ncbi:MAG TPA: hypothetical protein PLD48_08565 [Bacillota bacterium]|nr:hypothetical protein [Bacillota bacterium]HOK69596.1 hypothetical protein [Bacillota bacterium]HPP85970.1 hypothetical protein [Bacillota bacterium]
MAYFYSYRGLNPAYCPNQGNIRIPSVHKLLKFNSAKPAGFAVTIICGAGLFDNFRLLPSLRRFGGRFGAKNIKKPAYSLMPVFTACY